MNAGDIILSLVIIGIFSGLVVFNIVSVEMKKIKENWPEYRCNPIVMPMASQIGPPGTNTGQNFSFCIQNMQSGIMGFFLQPLEMIMALLGEVLTNILGGIAEISQFFSFFRTALQNIISSIYGIFFNATLQIIRVILMIKDVLNRLVATFFAISYIITSTAYTGIALTEASNQVLMQMEPPGSSPPPTTGS
jgi:hypothetical protein